MSTRDNLSIQEEQLEEHYIVASNLQQVRLRMKQALLERNSSSSSSSSSSSVRLIAVSKTKPIEMLLEAYHIGNQRYFGENYVQELISKVPLMPSDTQWHFIGPLQSNKASLLVKAIGLYQLACVESVDTMKLATKLNKAVESWVMSEEEKKTKDPTTTTTTTTTIPKKLNIFIQVNTSLEDTKNGLTNIQEVIDLVLEINSTCPYLQIKGLMTIGLPGDTTCFDTLYNYRKEVVHALGWTSEDYVKSPPLELSMGMSNDFEVAIEKGSTNIRVGSTIFGERIYPTIKKE